jgi:hypothetical protein
MERWDLIFSSVVEWMGKEEKGSHPREGRSKLGGEKKKRISG